VRAVIRSDVNGQAITWQTFWNGRKGVNYEVHSCVMGEADEEGRLLFDWKRSGRLLLSGWRGWKERDGATCLNSRFILLCSLVSEARKRAKRANINVDEPTISRAPVLSPIEGARWKERPPSVRKYGEFGGLYTVFERVVSLCEYWG
jgi:hypothetical protein